MFLSNVVNQIKLWIKKDPFQILLFIITIKLWLFLLASISYPLTGGHSNADSIVDFTAAGVAGTPLTINAWLDIGICRPEMSGI